jgi:putative RecB family exonuclease
MANYSHSKLSTFEQCRYKYKLQYIDKVKVEVPTTIEAFMGDLVHQTLEKLYSELKFQKLNSLKELLKFYNEEWDKEWTPEILIAKEGITAENYRKMGEKFITDYYNHYTPFDQMTILGLETEEKMTLPDGSNYHVRIDKLACKGNIYYICDYKTNNRMKDQEEADSDRQLAMYSIWVKDKFKDAKKVILLWHMLAFDKEITSERTDKELEKLQDETVALIKELESCKEFPRNICALCDYCVFKSMCPSFKHEADLETKSVKEFKEDDGVKLVDAYSVLTESIKKLEADAEVIKEKLIEFSKQKDIDVIFGSNKKASVKHFDKVVYPEDKEEFVALIKKKGLYDQFSSINYLKLNPKILKGEIDKDIIKLTKKEKDYRVSLSNKRDSDNN